MSIHVHLCGHSNSRGRDAVAVLLRAEPDFDVTNCPSCAGGIPPPPVLVLVTTDIGSADLAHLVDMRREHPGAKVVVVGLWLWARVAQEFRDHGADFTVELADAAETLPDVIRQAAS